MRLVIGPRMRGSDSGAARPWGPTTSGEETIWEQERALGHVPSGGTSMIIGSFDALNATASTSRSGRPIPRSK